MLTYIVIAKGRVEHVSDICEDFAHRKAKAKWGKDVRMMGLWTGNVSLDGKKRVPVWYN